MFYVIYVVCHMNLHTKEPHTHKHGMLQFKYEHINWLTLLTPYSCNVGKVIEERGLYKAWLMSAMSMKCTKG